MMGVAHLGFSFNGWGVTLVDGLDTMWIMGLYDDFYRTMPIFANMTFSLDEVCTCCMSYTVWRLTGAEILRSFL